MQTTDIVPNQSIYIRNINEKIAKEELKKCLYAVFSQFGKILDVVCLKTLKLRGQAWVVFTDVTSATNALKAMQGFNFFDKPMTIQYAKSKSEAVAKIDGTFKPKEKLEQKKKKADQQDQHKKEKKQATATAMQNRQVNAQNLIQNGAIQPNSLLFVQNLPPQTTSQMLQMLFSQYPGFREVRMVDSKPGISFVEYENEQLASVAMDGLNNFLIIPTNPMQISYAK